MPRIARARILTVIGTLVVLGSLTGCPRLDVDRCDGDVVHPECPNASPGGDVALDAPPDASSDADVDARSADADTRDADPSPDDSSLGMQSDG